MQVCSGRLRRGGCSGARAARCARPFACRDPHASCHREARNDSSTPKVVPLTGTTSSGSPSAWMNNIVSNCTNGCIPDVTAQQASNVWTPSALVPCPSGGCTAALSVVYYNPTTGLYRQSSSAPLSAPWQKTSYTRVLTVTQVSPNQMHITSTVTYLGYGHKTRTVSLSDDFYNWFPPLR
jgi:hypothetical protein